MKHHIRILLFALLTSSVFGQKMPNEIKHRLNPILEAVEVNDKEKEQLVVTIEKFQKNVSEIRLSGINVKPNLRANNKEYLKNVRQILGRKRYLTWREEVKKKNQSNRQSTSNE